MHRSKSVAVVCGVIAMGVVPSVAAARTKTVYADAPPSAAKVLQKYGAAVNAFFLTRVTVNVGDKVRFLQEGFHTIDLPGRSGKDLPLLVPGATATGVNDAAGNPFWFNGTLPSLGFNPLLVGRSGPSRYNGTQRVDSGLPLGKPKPLVVTFTKPGVYKYFCDVHPGMVGYVVVKAKGKPIPSAAQDAAALRAQVGAAEKAAKRLLKTKAPWSSVSLGASAPGGVEDYAMFPATLSVKVNTVVTFNMSKDSRELHTASFGPPAYLAKLANSLNGPNPAQQALYKSDPPLAGTAVVTPTSHGNGFVSTGIYDNDPSTAFPPTGRLKFTTPGTYHFICLIHPFMHGTIIVTR